MTGEVTQVKLAQERTHAAWIRTSLSFLVAIIAVNLYAPVNLGSFYLMALLSGGVAISALRVVNGASDMTVRLLAYGIMFAPAAVVLAF